MPNGISIQDLQNHAAERLSLENRRSLDRDQRLKLYQRFLKTEEHRIFLLHKAGENGVRVAAHRSALIDLLVCCLYQDGLDELGRDSSEYSIVATGGWGRGVLNPSSDLDLHFLTTGNSRQPSKADEAMIERILYMLYDCNFKVGHAVRTLKQTIQHANEDGRTKSSLIEARLIAGNPEVVEQLRAEFLKKCVDGHAEDYLRERLEDLQARHKKWFDTVFLQEPHVKEGCGALRDYQNLIWVTFFHLRKTNIAELAKENIFSQTAYRELQQGYEFLMRVRNDLHYTQGRAGDILTLRLQGDVARHFNYPQEGILHKTEAFMKDYYFHTTNIFQRCHEALDKFYLEELSTEKLPAWLQFFDKRKSSEAETVEQFVIENDRLHPSSSLKFSAEPLQLLKLFLHAQRRHLRLAPALVQKIQRHYDVINQEFRHADAAREVFEAILSSKGDVGFSLRQMHRVGVLGRYLPEFGALTNLVQHEFFHRYSADEHTLRCIEQLDALATDENPKTAHFRDLFLRLDDPFVIYLALLLHDTGRAANTDAHDQASAILAAKVCRRLSLSSKRRKLLLFLVDHHLTFWRTATTKNVEDPRVVEEFAKIMKDRERLDLLFLHTYADSKGTNDEGWTDWKAALIKQLYFSTVEFLEDSNSYLERAALAVQNLQRETNKLLEEELKPHLESHLNEVPDLYIRTQSAARVARHLELIDELQEDESTAAVIDWQALPSHGCSELTLVCSNKINVPARIAGAIASQQLNILSADILKRHDGIMILIFRICTTRFGPVENQRTIRTVDKMILRSLQNSDFVCTPTEIPPRQFSGATIPQRVYLNDLESDEYLVIELQAQDRLGLLHDVFSALDRVGMDVAQARISTTRGAAIDTFYVCQNDGTKPKNGAKIAELEFELSQLISTPSQAGVQN